MTIQARRTSRRLNSPKRQLIGHGLREIVLIFFGFVAIYLFISLLTYNGGDPGWSHSGPVDEIQNKGGIAGALFADLFFYLFGYFAYLFPLMVGYTGWLIYQGRHHDIIAQPKNLIIPGIGFILTLSAGCGLAIVHFMAESALLPTHAGGILGMWIGDGLVAIVDRLGATLILLAVFFTGITLLTGLSWLKLMDTLGYYTFQWLPIAERFMTQRLWPKFQEFSKNGLSVLKSLTVFLWQKSLAGMANAYERWKIRRAEWRKEREQYLNQEGDDGYDEYEERGHFLQDELDDSDKPLAKVKENSTFATIEDEEPHLVAEVYHSPITNEPPLLPSLNLLEPLPSKNSTPTAKMLSQRMIDAFTELQIDVNVNTVHLGPVLITYEIQPVTVVNTNHLEELSQALASALRVDSVRINEPQPGTLHVEIPNPKRQTIFLQELLKSPEYQDNTSPLPIALGQDVLGQAIIVDLTRVPHILMAGNNAEEQAVTIDTIILSLIYQSPPTTMRLLLIDSSYQQFSRFAELPHLLVPVLADMEKATKLLQWSVQEMEQRYRLMAGLSVRNIEDYNQALRNQSHNNQLEATDVVKAPLFYLVIIVNEIEELMKTPLGSQAEEAIVRLTQKSRAAGIHIILATQNPTVNVITGLIKANISTRMAFQVANKGESRTILGQPGAENLLGQGDMLYMTAGTGMPVRIHGCYVSEQDVDNVVTDLRTRATPQYLELE